MSEQATLWKEAVLNYYRYIDEGDYKSLYALFDNEIEYLRDGTTPLQGMTAFKKFYSEERIIAHGTHTDILVTTLPNAVSTTGRFSGSLKNGESVDVQFQEYFYFGATGLITRRITTFPTGARKI